MFNTRSRSPIRSFLPCGLGDGSAGCSYRAGTFYTTHGNSLSAALNAFESFSALTASTVKTLRKKVVSAARAHWVSEVLSMHQLSQGPNRGFKRGVVECFQ